VLASTDLGFLLSRCADVAVREGDRIVVLPAETVIRWRALQVATATPYLPGIEQLRTVFPSLLASTNGLLIPLRGESPEGVLAFCRRAGVAVSGSKIVYEGRREGEREGVKAGNGEGRKDRNQASRDHEEL
jgi:hypothetical protein